MPTVELSDETYKQMQSIAIPFVDTPETVIGRAVAFYIEKNIDLERRVGEVAVDPSVRQFDPNSPPPLTHTKILSASFNGELLGRNDDSWNGLLHVAARAAANPSHSTDDFKSLMVVRFVKGEKHDEGFKPVDGTEFSIQGQDANGAWRGIRYIAQSMGIAVSVKFVWRDKEGAALPGVEGQMTIPPRK